MWSWGIARGWRAVTESRDGRSETAPEVVKELRNVGSGQVGPRKGSRHRLIERTNPLRVPASAGSGFQSHWARAVSRASFPLAPSAQQSSERYSQLAGRRAEWAGPRSPGTGRTFHVKHLERPLAIGGSWDYSHWPVPHGYAPRWVVFHVKQLGYLSARNEEYRLVQTGSLCNFRAIVDFLCEHAGFRE